MSTFPHIPEPLTNGAPLDTFPRDVAAVANRIAYGAEVSDPLLDAAARIWLDDREPGVIPGCSNGALRFALHVPARPPVPAKVSS